MHFNVDGTLAFLLNGLEQYKEDGHSSLSILHPIRQSTSTLFKEEEADVVPAALPLETCVFTDAGGVPTPPQTSETLTCAPVAAVGAGVVTLARNATEAAGTYIDVKVC